MPHRVGQQQSKPLSLAADRIGAVRKGAYLVFPSPSPKEEDALEARFLHIPTDRETGRPRGFGFVEMEEPSAIEQAIQMFNGYSVSGRALVVNQARPREARPQY